MTIDLPQRLSAAAHEGIITQEQADRLAVYLAAPEPALPVHSVYDASLSAPRDEPVVNSAEETEMPRFVRGFHDVLITLGIVILLSGLAGLTHAVVALAACIVLSEVLVRRQRLALPAVVLTIAYVASGTMFLRWLTSVLLPDLGSETVSVLLLFLFGYAVLMVPYYWRYRVPLALSSMIVVIVGCLSLVASALINVTVYSVSDPSGHPLVMAGCGLVGAVIVFLLALRFDLADPARVTRRSDVAFWLHLVTAPALLYSILALLFYSRNPTLFWNIGTLTSDQPVSVILIVAVFVLLGVLIDRRAFVTSGLVSLGFSMWNLIQSNQIPSDNRFFVVLVLLGGFVLLIGGLWISLRRLIVGALPADVRGRLPLVR